MLSLSWLYGEPQTSGVIKQVPEDFMVSEDLGYQPDGEGEHLLVRVRKTGCNTQFVAEQLAKFAGIPAKAVSYAGLKDRHAVTEQWFCLHIPGLVTPDMGQFQLEGCQVLSAVRHKRKLRIGQLKGNAFHLVIRQIGDRIATEKRLVLIMQGGVPNYFGEQRFGRDGSNLVQAERWAKGEIIVKARQKRSFYLSALRSALFNRIASARVAVDKAQHVLSGDALQLTGRGSWFVAKSEELALLQQRVLAGELSITAPLPGEGELGTELEALAFERAQLSADDDTSLILLTRERLASTRRAVIVQPKNMTWLWLDDQTLELSFELPAGSFATSVVRELVLTTADELLAESFDE